MAEAAATRSTALPRRTIAGSIEGRASWVAACVALAILSFSYGSPLLVVVGLKPISEDLGTSRSILALASAFTWVGTGAGGILMGWAADRIGLRPVVMFGAAMIALGLAISASGNVWAMLIGHAVFVGLLGNAAFFAPLLVYVSRWFDRRRGAALALISSGQYIAGMVWPTIFERAMAHYGWRATMIGYAAVLLIALLPIAAFFLHRPPDSHAAFAFETIGGRRRVLGLHPNLVLGLLAAAGFMCCIPMAVPQSHLVAFCSDLGIPAIQSAAMLSVLQAAAFCSRVGWGWLTDRIGGLATVFAGSACQALAITAFLWTQDEAGLFLVSAAYGLGFSGIVPAYVMAVRELYPSHEASWRVPVVLFISMGGMAVGSWFAGWVYDSYHFYAPAFAIGALFNLGNLLLVGFLAIRQRWGGYARPAEA